MAIARKNVEEEAIDIMCKPEFTGSAILTTIATYTSYLLGKPECPRGQRLTLTLTPAEVNEGTTALRMLLLVEQT